MVEEDRYSSDILMQVASVQEALKGVSHELVRNHLSHCARRELQGSDEQAQAAVEELDAVEGDARTVRRRNLARGSYGAGGCGGDGPTTQRANRGADAQHCSRDRRRLARKITGSLNIPSACCSVRCSRRGP